MPGGDNFADLIALARRELPDVPPEVWAQLAALASLHFGAQRLYVPRRKKACHLEQLAQAEAAADAERLAAQLGVSVRHLFRLKALRRPDGG